MAVTNSQIVIPLKAGADLSSSQYCIVKVNDENQVVVATAGTDKAFGVLQNTPVSGEAAEVAIAGRTKIRVSAGIADGALITATTGGEGVTTTTAGDWVTALALTTVANNDEVVDAVIVNTRVPA